MKLIPLGIIKLNVKNICAALYCRCEIITEREERKDRYIIMVIILES